MFHSLNNVLSNPNIRRARDASGFVVHHVRFRRIKTNGFAVDSNSVAFVDFIAEYRDAAIDRYTSFSNKSVCLAPGTIALFGKEFIDPHEVKTYLSLHS